MSSGLISSIQSSFSTFYRIVDLLLISMVFFIATYSYGVELDTHYYLVLLISLSCFLFLSQTFELYRSWRTSTTFALLSYTSLVWVSCCLVLMILAYFTKTGANYSRVAMGIWLVATLFGLCAWRVLFRALLVHFRKSGLNAKSVIIIGATPTGLNLAAQINQNPQHGLKLYGFYEDRPAERLPDMEGYEVKGTVAEGVALVKANPEISHVYIAMPMKAEARITDILNQCSDTTATVHIIPDFFIFNLLHARWQNVGNMQTLSIFDSPFNGFNRAVKRLEDLVLASIILAIISVPMLFIGLAVKLTSKGPIIFKQKRYGLDGKEICIYKFRSMTLVNKKVDDVVQATRFDARITPLGSFLRRTSLDELPQFINVLQGNMSIVGPRPHAVQHNEEYRKLIDGYMLRHKAKPGITGWAQINGWRGETDTLDKMERRIEFDLKYIHRWSLLFDLKIILLTIFKGFINKNAY
ncbi:undecaprenyl-phosphate glucose phosphotransferase [Colwellia asteriadis]|uniref:Undecaprenyl-phosphate glucose phosphotransferase n=1 Tax=Colwellia asteriadis TaxID=517723 RepID=A0ABN1L257_9GAMM